MATAQEETKQPDDPIFDSSRDALNFINDNILSIIPDDKPRTIGSAIDYLRKVGSISPRDKMDLDERCGAIASLYKRVGESMADIKTLARITSAHWWKGEYHEPTLNAWSEIAAETKLAAQMGEDAEKQIVALRQSVAIVRVLVAGILRRVP